MSPLEGSVVFDAKFPKYWPWPLLHSPWYAAVLPVLPSVPCLDLLNVCDFIIVCKLSQFTLNSISAVSALQLLAFANLAVSFAVVFVTVLLLPATIFVADWATALNCPVDGVPVLVRYYL